MKDYKEISNRIYQELTDSEKGQCSIEIIENIILIGEYVNYFGKDVYTNNIFIQDWFDGYFDINIIIESVNSELVKDKIFIERDLLISIINLIRRNITILIG